MKFHLCDHSDEEKGRRKQREKNADSVSSVLEINKRQLHRCIGMALVWLLMCMYVCVCVCACVSIEKQGKEL